MTYMYVNNIRSKTNSYGRWRTMNVNRTYSVGELDCDAITELTFVLKLSDSNMKLMIEKKQQDNQLLNQQLDQKTTTHLTQTMTKETTSQLTKSMAQETTRQTTTKPTTSMPNSFDMNKHIKYYNRAMKQLQAIRCGQCNITFNQQQLHAKLTMLSNKLDNDTKCNTQST